MARNFSLFSSDTMKSAFQISLLFSKDQKVLILTMAYCFESLLAIDVGFRN